VGATPHCRFIFAGPPKPGYFLVLLEDDGGDVISAMGAPPGRCLQRGLAGHRALESGS
jgi:hypothetical protein